MEETTKKLFDFDDVLIEPTVMSKINSRSEIYCRNHYGNLPLMTAPMDTVVGENNFHLFKDKGIMPVLPRIPNPNKEWVDTNIFLSYSLQDFEKIFLENKIQVPDGQRILALIDVANGHMESLYEMAKEAKKNYGYSICLMVGNVANPETFEKYCHIGVDMVRIGIGNGNGCLTTVQTGVGYPMASLIKECSDIQRKKHLIGSYLPYHKDLDTPYKTDIVADGGFKKYSDIIKALALGADYVMLGSMFNKCLESAGETTKIADGLGNHEVVNQYSQEARQMFHAELPLYKTFRGMSTKEVQMSWGKENLTTSEGVVRRNKVEYTIEGWVRNFEDYLKSAMSYTGKKELHRFIGGVGYNFITQNSFKRFDK
jgi:IMP dehydrogenase/GMP reductase